MSFYIFLIVGLGAVAIGAYTISVTKKNKAKFTSSTAATIVKVELAFGAVDGKRNQDVGHIDFSPVYEYTVDGVTYSEPGKMYTDKKNMYKVGDTTLLYYKPEDPKDFYTDKDGIDFSKGIIYLIVGVAIIAAGVLQNFL